uniref:Uncharacterized protein n=1 Tax=Steinernema glaseri TaxID=37863 RepID=A0A1I7ZB24_9BILA
MLWRKVCKTQRFPSLYAGYITHSPRQNINIAYLSPKLHINQEGSPGRHANRQDQRRDNWPVVARPGPLSRVCPAVYTNGNRCAISFSD